MVHPRATGLDDRATLKVTYRPGSGAEVLTRLKSGEGDLASALGNKPVVALVGRTGLGEDGRLAEAVAAFVRSGGGKVMPLARRSNVYGALDMGLAPSLAPGRVRCDQFSAWGTPPTSAGKDAAGIVEGLASGDILGLVLAGADPIRDFPNGARARKALEAARFVVSLDQFLTDSSRLADVVLPVEGFAEKEGTVTNVEGRVQKVNRVVPGPGQSRPDWSILDDLAERMGTSIGLGTAEAISKEIAAVAPAYAGVTWELLAARRRGRGAPRRRQPTPGLHPRRLARQDSRR